MELTDKRLLRHQCYIDGAWVEADSGDTITVTNPADGSDIGTVPAMGPAETRRAIEAADAAWGPWRAKTGKERAQILRAWFDLMMANRADLAGRMNAGQGQPPAAAPRQRV